MFAIIKTGGKQFRVQNGDVIFVEKLNAAEGETVNFDVLMLENDGEVKIGAPVVEAAKVTGKGYFILHKPTLPNFKVF